MLALPVKIVIPSLITWIKLVPPGQIAPHLSVYVRVDALVECPVVSLVALVLVPAEAFNTSLGNVDENPEPNGVLVEGRDVGPKFPIEPMHELVGLSYLQRIHLSWAREVDQECQLQSEKIEKKNGYRLIKDLIPSFILPVISSWVWYLKTGISGHT